LKILTTLPRAIGTADAKGDATKAMEDTEAAVKTGNMLRWRFMIGIGRKPE
jgi:hypothetical protein